MFMRCKQTHRISWILEHSIPNKFLTELKRRAAACNFLKKDRMLRDKINFTELYCDLKTSRITPKGRHTEKAVNIVELSNSQIDKSKSSEKVQPSQVLLQMLTKTRTQNSETKTPSGKQDPQVNQNSHKRREKLKFNSKCFGYKHKKQTDKCPAWGKAWDNRKRLNHFKSKCKLFMHLTSSIMTGKILMINGSWL